MPQRFKLFHRGLLSACLGLAACSSWAVKPQDTGDSLLLKAARVFDGREMKADTAVLVKDGKIADIGPLAGFKDNSARVLDLGDATLMPGIIELHAHLNYRQVPAETVLEHGVTTLRDVR